jgi:Flp pilus assembly pilin Flp
MAWKMNKKRYQKGQYLIEYAVVAAVVASAFVAMSTYVFRSVQATQQMVNSEMQAQ